jgi:hypothetical protein
MKKIVMVLLVFAVLAIGATTALAAGGPPKPNPHAAFVLDGKITAIDGTTLSVDITHSNGVTKKLLGATKTVTLTTTGETSYLMWTSAGAKPAAFADLAVGQNIMAEGRVAAGVWTAQRILIRPETRAAFVLSGPITAITDTLVTVDVLHSNAVTRQLLGATPTVTLTTTADTSYLMWTPKGTKKISFADLAVEQSIMVQGRVTVSSTGEVWTAQRIMVELGTAKKP